jgi:hypothetical protein
MVCYGPRVSTVVVACAAAYAFLHQVIGRILHIAGLVIQAVLITCIAAAAVVLLTWTVRTIQRRRAAAGACTTCRFRCQQPLDLRPQSLDLRPKPLDLRPQTRPVGAGHSEPVLLPVPSLPVPAATASAEGRTLVLD